MQNNIFSGGKSQRDTVLTRRSSTEPLKTAAHYAALRFNFSKCPWWQSYTKYVARQRGESGEHASTERGEKDVQEP